jgi:hypothetical protein
MTDKEETKELLLRVEMYDCGDKGIMGSYLLPHIEDETWVEFYQTFFQALCLEIANVPGADKLMGVLPTPEELENEEGEDQS